MGSEWKRVVVSDVCELIVDCVNKTAPVVEELTPYKMLRTTNIKDGRIDREDCRRVSKETFDKWTRRADVRLGDVILTREAPLGEVGYVDFTDTVFLGQRLMQYRANPALLEPRFLLYSFLSKDLQNQFGAHEGNGSTVSHIRVGDCSKFELKLPPLPEQKAIAHILGSLDDKIELNRRMNETLEGMAQALFKSWFVDFDPVLDNAIVAGNPIPDALADRAKVRRQALEDGTANREIAAQFPSSFVETEEMGWIPEGWEVVPLPDVTTFREGPGILAHDFHEQGVRLIRLAGLKSGVSLLDGCNFLDPAKVEKKWSQFRLLKGDILLSSSASLGRVAEVDDEAMSTIPYTGIISFRPIKEKTLQRYVYRYLTSSHFQEQVVSMGAGSVLNHFGPTHLKKMHMLMPLLAIQKSFSNFLDPEDRAQYQRLKQSDTLVKLRDTLLPKLISGELRVGDAERIVGEVGE